MATIHNHVDEFEYRYDNLFSREYGFFRPGISHIVRKHFECGDLEQGFARVRCPDCLHEYLLAFSCRGAGSVHQAIARRWFRLVGSG
ncbi:transposase zinc-binding domain-containing protein [Desulfoprunum benzoelyticum]|uniref:transposase zinc-binding domain-containing protein n=1 Tax=Desulfoprunum benzoelyticum TaxID=1506996 RepID=UPI001622E33A|nr:transposase zinc-binding domain-containing protein [Desulfoprunum benzoelyticum]